MSSADEAKATSRPSALEIYTQSAGHSFLYAVHPTVYGGRGAFASKPIPEGTVILECEGPYASVILRKFRREVCAWCFAWAFERLEGRKGCWSVKLETEGIGNWSPWFCKNRCRSCWIDAYSWRRSGQGEGGDDRSVGDMVNLMVVLERTLLNYKSARMKARGRIQKLSSPTATTLTGNPFTFLDTWQSEDVSEDKVDWCWRMAETTTSNIKGSKALDFLEAWNEDSAEDPTELLTEFETDCARFVLDGLFRQALETTNFDVPSPESNRGAASSESGGEANAMDAGKWPDLFQLQDNELQTLKAKPYMLGLFIRVYAFLKHVVFSARPTRKQAQAARNALGDFPKSKDLLDTLAGLLEASDSVRAILARDHGNVFGIWEKGLPNSEGDADSSDDGSEMLGWGIYVFGSYFNHDCTPNLAKAQRGRSLQFVTTRDIGEGEELCINYIDVSKDNSVMKRNEELKKEWYFECGCIRCARETVEGGLPDAKDIS